ncbi:hypothetical protein BHE74_00058430 [Ensete ventricosum]|nr:hypothetical protein BHE74_00058430 [Ensete ventricosum]RZR96269.1 hypothetical protein BHM03_00025249 [Ensete ventricosum]
MSPGAPLGRSAARVVELRSGGRVSTRVGRRFLQEGQVGSRRDPSDGQVSYVADFATPLLRRGAGAFIATVTRVSVPESLIFFIACHTVASHHVVRVPCGEARACR